MVKVKALKKLLDQVSDDAKVYVYEGEDSGICITHGDHGYWIRVYDSDIEDTYTHGFNRNENER